MNARHLLALLVLSAAILIAPGCIFGEDSPTFEIPDTYTTSDQTYTLLYSTLGYDLASTKRVLIRLNATDVEPAQGLAFKWRLIDEGGRVERSGLAQFAGTGWGIAVWSADFTELTRPGTYRMTIEAPDVALATLPFAVDDFILFRTTFVPVALDNAESRAAPPELDGGYFESNTREGTVGAHAEFLLGLVAMYQRRRPAMTEDQRVRTRAAIDRAVTYILLLSDAATGQVQGTAETRPYQGSEPTDTAEAARALARYAVALQQEDLTTADRAYRRARSADDWMMENAPDEYPLWTQAAVALDFYRFSPDLAQLDRAVRAVREYAPTYDIRTMDRPGGDAQSHFEPMYELWQSLADHPDRAMWEETAARVGGQYAEMMQKNAFGVIAPGTTNTDEGSDAAVEWDESDVEPPSGEGSDLRISNEWFLARTMDAVYLAEISGMRDLEPAITGYALWFGGIHPGIPVDRASGVAAGGPLTAASFIVGAGVPSVRPWSTWEWQRPHPLASVAAGFRGGFTFDNTEAASNTSILRDGLWLRATIAYEEFLHPGDGPAKAEPEAVEGEGVRVASIVASEDADGGASLLVTVVDPTGNPLSNVTVSGVWVGTRAEGQASEEVLRTVSCVTVSGGSCSLRIGGDEVPGARPRTAAITSLEHPDYTFDAAAGSLGEPHVFD